MNEQRAHCDRFQTHFKIFVAGVYFEGLLKLTTKGKKILCPIWEGTIQGHDVSYITNYKSTCPSVCLRLVWGVKGRERGRKNMVFGEPRGTRLLVQGYSLVGATV